MAKADAWAKMKAPINRGLFVLVLVVDNRLAASTVLVFLLNNGGTVGRLPFFNHRRALPIPVPVPVVITRLADSCTSANRANADANTNFFSQRRRSESRCGGDNQSKLH